MKKHIFNVYVEMLCLNYGVDTFMEKKDSGFVRDTGSDVRDEQR